MQRYGITKHTGINY